MRFVAMVVTCLQLNQALAVPAPHTIGKCARSPEFAGRAVDYIQEIT